MGRPLASIRQVFLYRLTSPILFLPWIWTQFFASAISWGFIALYSVWTWNVTFYYIPLLTIGAYVLIAPFQQSQVQIIEIIEFVTDEIFEFANETFFPIWEDLFYVVQPGCWAYNFLWNIAISLFNLALYNPIKLGLNVFFPYNPVVFFETVTIPGAGIFPVSMQIDTSSSPDWLIGPYDRSLHDRIPPRAILKHDDPVARKLVRWITDRHDGLLHGIHPEVLRAWTNPLAPASERRSISEQILREAMDRAAGIEQRPWWEPAPGETHWTSRWSAVFCGDDGNDDIGNNATAVPSGTRRKYLSVWNAGLVEMDTIPDSIRRKAEKRGYRIPAGSKHYRFVDGKDPLGERDLTFDIFQKTAEIFALFFDVIANVLVALWNIVSRVGKFLFENIPVFFSTAIQFMANLFNQIWAEFLGLPCLKFNSIEVFAISLSDCICTPIRKAAIELAGSNLATLWFNYQRPSSISGLPQAMLGCVGLGCINITLLFTQPNMFIGQLLGTCTGINKGWVPCCIIEPVGCFTNIVKKLTNCPCSNNFNTVSPPSCNWSSPASVEWLLCIISWLMNNMFGSDGKSVCQVSTCPGQAGSPGERIQDLSTRFVECIGLSVLDSGAVLGRIKSFVKSFLPDFDDIGADRRTMPVSEYYLDASVPGGKSVIVPSGRVSAWSIRPEEDEQETRKHAARAGINIRTSNVTTLIHVVPDGYTSLIHADWDRLGLASQLVSPEEVDMRVAKRLAEDVEPYDEYGRRKPLLAVFGDAVSPTSRTRHRAELQAHVDRRLYGNPYIRAASSRLYEILRDLWDFAEWRLVGPDPFLVPPHDADPDLDPRAQAARYLDESVMENQVYAFNQQAMLTNPYYAGLHKLVFQLGIDEEVDGVPKETQQDLAMQAMQAHRDDPVFHIGRIVSAMRQMFEGITVVTDRVWWDPDTYAFHFPTYRQIHDLMVQAHVPVAGDDMRSALMGLVRTQATPAQQVLEDEALAYDDDLLAGRVEAEARPYEARTYSGIVQLEVAARTIVTRLLVPERVDAMLDLLATDSPLHGRYVDRMRHRMAALRIESEARRRRHRSLLADIEEASIRWRHERMAAQFMDDETGDETREFTRLRQQLRDVGNPSWARHRLDPSMAGKNGTVGLALGQRVRFEDGHEGVYLGTFGEGSMVPRSATKSWRGGPGYLGPREITIASIAGLVWQVVQFIVQNWQLIVTAFAGLVTTPWGRVWWESWFSFIYFRIVRPLFSEGLQGVFGSLFQILQLVFDFIVLNDAIYLFLLNEILRYLLCYVWALGVFLTVWAVFWVINMLTLGMTQLPGFLILFTVAAIVILFPYCPPEQVIIDRKMTQPGPWRYFDDIIKCYDNPKLGSIDIGKGVYNGICVTKNDCPGHAACICENKGGLYESTFVSFVDDSPCGTQIAPTGQCLCWPSLDCQFMFPRISEGTLFETDCPGVFGYRISRLTWYQTSDYVRLMYDIYQNFWISLRFVTRKITSSPHIPILLFPILIMLGFLVLFYGSIYVGVGLIALVMVWEYGLPLWTNLTIDHIIPGLETVGSTGIWPLKPLSDWILHFLRFPNFTTANPLGVARQGEAVCWVFNAGSMFGGFSVAFWFWATILALTWYGLGPILWFAFNNLMTPVRVVLAPVWLYYQNSALQQHFKQARNIVRRSVPKWMRQIKLGPLKERVKRAVGPKLARLRRLPGQIKDAPSDKPGSLRERLQDTLIRKYGQFQDILPPGVGKEGVSPQRLRQQKEDWWPQMKPGSMYPDKLKKWLLKHSPWLPSPGPIPLPRSLRERWLLESWRRGQMTMSRAPSRSWMSPPDTALNRWISRFYPDPRQGIAAGLGVPDEYYADVGAFPDFIDPDRTTFIDGYASDESEEQEEETEHVLLMEDEDQREIGQIRRRYAESAEPMSEESDTSSPETTNATTFDHEKQV